VKRGHGRRCEPLRFAAAAVRGFGGTREPRAAFVLCAIALALTPRAAVASDFWDEVRSPGLGSQRAHVNKGRDALGQNRPQLALQHADAAVARRAERADGHVLRGRALGALARHGEATAAFEQALALDPHALDDGTAATAAAQSALIVERADLALRVLTSAIARTRNAQMRARALLLTADALQAHGPSALRRAIAAYREALVESAFEKQSLLGLAIALHRAGEHDEALALAVRAGVKPDPTWLSPREHAARMALWLLAIGDRAGAEQAWARAAEGGHAWSEHARGALALSRTGEP
jgi:tetratricopeptide (TPR) repeat protein